MSPKVNLMFRTAFLALYFSLTSSELITLEAEDGSYEGSQMYRSAASGKATVLLVASQSVIGRNLCPIFVQFRCPRSPTTFSPYDSMDFYVLNSNFDVVTSKNLQFLCNLRSNIDLFFPGNFMLFTIIVLVQVS